MGGRPKEGYRNSAGQAIPGTHDPISRYKDSNGLIRWAYGQGKKGVDLYDRTAIDIGTAVHSMAELDLKGRPDKEIEQEAHAWLKNPDDLHKAWTCFRAFKDWRQQCHVRAIAQEVVLVSETHSYGGTPDTVAMFGNGGLGLIDFKTSPKPYPDHWLALAAHGKLWLENHPDKPLDAGYHLILLPKDGSPFQHHVKTDLTLQWEIFRRQLDLYRLEKEGLGWLGKAVDAPEPPPVSVQAEKPAKAPRRRAANGKADPAHNNAGPAHTNARPATLAEMLRHYGHVPEYA